MPFTYNYQLIHLTSITVKIADCWAYSDSDSILIVTNAINDEQEEIISFGKKYGRVKTDGKGEYLIEFTTPKQIFKGLNLLMALKFNNLKPNEKDKLISYQLTLGQPDHMEAVCIDYLVRPKLQEAILMILNHEFDMYFGTTYLSKAYNNKIVPKAICSLFEKMTAFYAEDYVPITLKQFKDLYQQARNQLSPSLIKPSFFNWGLGQSSPQTLELFNDIIRVLGMFNQSKKQIQDAIFTHSKFPLTLADIIADYCDDSPIKYTLLSS
jgi:hypothetical protein